ncbi:uncharacterized protein LOC131285374, partial [Anopheles ziemanni]|uniref:uncharacterized protein LOC131285374 n=1 Tax=Anopheles ziemanni TaxID=345580 RepID=UPI00265E96EF
PPPPRRGGPIVCGTGGQQTATSFLQLSQDHLTIGQQQEIQPGMKLFPNYTPPIPPHHLHNGNGGISSGSSNPANHHYHQITYQTQTLAPLRLNQDHFLPSQSAAGGGNKTNTISASVVGVNQAPTGGGGPPRDDDDTLDVNDDGEGSGESQSEATSPPQSPISPTPPELPIRNGLLAANYPISTLNHINNNGSNSSGGSGGSSNTSNGSHHHHHNGDGRARSPVTPPPPSVTTTSCATLGGSGRKQLAIRHYH